MPVTRWVARRWVPAGMPDPDDLEMRYRSLFLEHPHPVFALDPGGRLTEVNPASGRVSGYGTEGLVGMNLVDLVDPRDHARALEAFARVLGRVAEVVELRIRRSDGTTADLVVTGIPRVVEEEVIGIYCIAEDVTERNRIARDLEVTRRLAVEASEAKSEFVARMSHEVRTPLTSILAAVELLADTETTPEQQELVATLDRSSTRLLALVDSVLDFAASADPDPRVTESFDLHAVVRDATALVEKRARQKGLELTARLDDDVPVWVDDHPTWTSQILVNLLSNAVDHTELGSVRLTVSTTATARSGPAIVYRVTDTGVGIDPLHHDRIFEPFTRVDPRRPDSGGRTGLGLSIVKQLVTISGGSVAVESRLGRGSTFFVTMPATAVPPPAA